MFKTIKKKPEKVKEKLDFKFRFHATRVPLTGWDKLVVSLTPVETGKPLLKTPRTNVRNGNCQWLDSVIESTRLVHDVKTKEYEEKLYKLVVSMGSSRSGILGEETINLAEYAMSNDSAQIVLPLKNCSAGTLLHVNIQCITPKASTRPLAFVQSSSRALSQRSDLSVEPGDQEFACDEDLDDSDLSESNTEMSASLSGSMSAIPSFMKPGDRTSAPSRIVLKDGYGSSHLRCSSDSLEVPSTPSSLNGSGRSVGNADTPSPTSSGSSLPKRSSSRDGSGKTRVLQDVKSPTSSSDRGVPASSNLTGQGLKNIWQDLHGRPIDRLAQGTSSDTGLRSTQVHHNGSQSSLQADLEAAEITIEELRSESTVWQRQAHKLGLEVDMLKQKLGLEVKQGAEFAAEKSAVTVERDRLKLELDQLQSEKKASQERENGEDHASRRAEDTRRMMKEMEEEIAYQKEVNINLRLQLQKTQDSSMELVLAIKDMEETLDEQKTESNQLKAMNSDLEFSLSEHRKQSLALADVERTWMEKLIEKDQAVQDLQAKLLAAEIALTMPTCALRPEASGHDVVMLTLQEKLEKLQHELKELETESKELSNENTVLYMSLSKASEALEAKSQLVIRLEAELKNMSEVSVQMHSMAMTAFAPEVSKDSIKFKAVTEELEEDVLQATKDANRGQREDDNTLAEQMPSLITELQTESSQFQNKVKGTKDQSLGLLVDMEIATTEGVSCGMLAQQEVRMFEEEMIKLEEYQALGIHNLTAVQVGTPQNIEDLECELAGTKETVQELQILRAQAEQSLFVMDREKLLLSERLMGTQTSRDESVSVVHSREVAGAEQLLGILDNKAASRGLASRVTELENLQAELEDKLLEALRSKRLTESQLQDVTNSLREALLKVAELEMSKAKSEIMLQDAQEACRLNMSRTNELEIHLSALAEEMESPRSPKKVNETRKIEMKNEKGELEQLLSSLIITNRVTVEQGEVLIHDIASSRKHSDMLLVSKNLERRLLELGNINGELESQMEALVVKNLDHHVERISGLEPQMRYVTEERDTDKQGKEDTDIQLKDVQSKHSSIEGSLRDFINVHQQKLSEEQANALESTEELHTHKIMWQNLETLVEQLKCQIDAHEICRKDLEIMADDLLRYTSELEEQLLKLNGDHDTKLEKRGFLEAEMLRLESENNDRQRADGPSIQAISAVTHELEQRACRAEEALNLSNLENTSFRHLELEVERLTYNMPSIADEKDKLALVEALQHQSGNSEWEDKFGNLKEENHRWPNSDDSAFEVNVAELQSSDEALDRTVKLIRTENKRLAGARDKMLAITVDFETSKKDLVRLKSFLDKASGYKLALRDAFQAVHDENKTLEKSLALALADVEDMRCSRTALEEKILQLQLDLDAQKAAVSIAAEQQAESPRLKRQNNGFRQQLTACQDKGEFCRKLQLLDREIQFENKLKEGVDLSISSIGGTMLSRSLSRSSSKVGPTSPSRETKELLDKVKSLEVELKSKISTLELAKRDFHEKETVLYNRIELLELANEQLAQGPDSGLDQLQAELNRLQMQNSLLARREQGLLSELGAQDVLKREVKRLQQNSEHLEKKLMRFKDTTKDGDILEKVLTLEMELGEALEANNMYKSQLRSAFAEQQNVHAAALQNLGDVDQVISDLLMYKRQSNGLEEELKEMRERYSRMSLQFAEVEAQREQLVMSMRTLKNSRKS